MIESLNMEQFVQNQIRSAVDDYVSSVISDEHWTQLMEQRIIKHVQDRITARFSNIQTVPDLVQTVKTSVADLITQGHVPGIDQYVDQASILRAVDVAVEQQIGRSFDLLALDPDWVAKIETQITQKYLQRLSEWISNKDINSLVVSQIDASIDRWQDRLKKDFATQGIKDSAQTLELDVAPGQVTVKNTLACQDAIASGNMQVKGSLQACDLILTGTINTDNRSWNELSHKIAQDTLEQMTDQWRQDLVEEVLAIAKTQGIEFNHVKIKGRPLIEDGTLNPSITHSYLRSVGTLDRLAVTGDVDLTQTLHIRPRRLGINTADPEMAFSVWDEEVSVVAGKFKQQHAFVGTSRLNALSLGVNRKSFIEIDTEGLTTIKSLRIDRHRISFGTEVPGYSGTRGDIVFNSNPNEGTAFAWVCLGAFRWQPLKAIA